LSFGDLTQDSMFRNIPTFRLMQIAGVGGVFVIGNAILMKYLMQKRVQESPYLQEARDAVLKNKALVQFLGEPVEFGHVNLGDSQRNYSTGTEAKFEIPVKGSDHAGVVYIASTRSSDGEEGCSPQKHGWKLDKLEITVDDKPNHKLVLI